MDKDEVLNAARYVFELVGAIVVVWMAAPALRVDLPGGLVWMLSAVLGAMALIDFLWGLGERRGRWMCWGTAFWRAVWGIELAALAWLATPMIRAFTAIHLTCFLIGFYLQVKGVHQLLGEPASGRAGALKDLAIGLVGMALPLVL